MGGVPVSRLGSGLGQLSRLLALGLIGPMGAGGREVGCWMGFVPYGNLLGTAVGVAELRLIGILGVTLRTSLGACASALASPCASSHPPGSWPGTSLRLCVGVAGSCLLCQPCFQQGCARLWWECGGTHVFALAREAPRCYNYSFPSVFSAQQEGVIAILLQPGALSGCACPRSHRAVGERCLGQWTVGCPPRRMEGALGGGREKPVGARGCPARRGGEDEAAESGRLLSRLEGSRRGPQSGCQTAAGRGGPGT